MKTRLRCCVFTLVMLLAAYLAGCSQETSGSGPRTSPGPHRQSKVLRHPQPSSKIELSSLLQVERIALSSGGEYVAVIASEITERHGPYLMVWEISSGKQILKLSHIGLKQGLRYLGWHPSKPLLVVSGGTDAPAQYGGSSGGLFLVNMPSGRIRYVWFEGDPKVPIAWMPDGIHVFTPYGPDFDPHLVNTNNGKTRRIYGTTLGNVRDVKVSPQGTLAIHEITPLDSTRTEWRLLLYERVKGKGERYVRTGKIEAQRAKGDKIISAPMQPEFLPDGRLAYLLLSPQSRDKVMAEVIVSDKNGVKQEPWLKLPPVDAALVEGNPRSSGRIWALSGDGKLVAYVRDNAVFAGRVDAPTLATTSGKK